MFIDDVDTRRTPRARSVALLGAAIAGAAWLAGAAPVWAVAAGVFYFPLILNAVIDWHTSRLVVALTNTSIGILALILAGVAVTGDPKLALYSLVIGAAVGGVVAAVSALSRGSLIGMGDARLMIPLTAWHALDSPGAIVGWLVLASAGHVALIVLMRMRGDRRAAHPFGPSLITASVVCSVLVLLRQ